MERGNGGEGSGGVDLLAFSLRVRIFGSGRAEG
jgi:hypothetical protein